MFLGWGVFIQQFQLNELDDRMIKPKKGQNVNKSTEETAKLDGKMSMDAKLIGKFITQEVAVAMAKKQNSTKRKLKNGERWKSWSIRRVRKKWNEGRWMRLQ